MGGALELLPWSGERAASFSIEVPDNFSGAFAPLQMGADRREELTMDQVPGGETETTTRKSVGTNPERSPRSALSPLLL